VKTVPHLIPRLATTAIVGMITSQPPLAAIRSHDALIVLPAFQTREPLKSRDPFVPCSLGGASPSSDGRDRLFRFRFDGPFDASVDVTQLISLRENAISNDPCVPLFT
jgi:hypothetical protein